MMLLHHFCKKKFWPKLSLTGVLQPGDDVRPDIYLVQYLNSSAFSDPKCVLIQPSTDLAFEAYITHCRLGFELLVNIIPRSLSSVVSSNSQTFPCTFMVYA